MARAPQSPRLSPRMSVNDLAQYMVASETTKLGIIRRAKYPQVPTVTRYRDVRPVACAYLTDANRSLSILTAAEEMFQHRAQDRSESPLRQDDARQSIEVLRALQGLRNRLTFDFRIAPQNQPRLTLAGVDVSVYADLLVYGVHRGTDQIGAAILRMTQDDAETETARTRRRDMGLYVATITRLHAEQNLAGNLPVSNRLCMSIDIQHGEVFQAPDANTRRMNDVENACRFIAAIWASV